VRVSKAVQALQQPIRSERLSHGEDRSDGKDAKIVERCFHNVTRWIKKAVRAEIIVKVVRESWRSHMNASHTHVCGNDELPWNSR
jgi:hypothetical protein